MNSEIGVTTLSMWPDGDTPNGFLYPIPIPEPASASLFAVGAVLLALRRKRR